MDIVGGPLGTPRSGGAENREQALNTTIQAEAFFQFQFARQWSQLREYANQRQVRIMGDLPIFVAHDSADVWSHQELFQLERDGHMSVVAGVPPDYFSATGQLWGNPIYRWDRMAERQYDWWVGRFRHAFDRLDLVRLDHFRGFESYWEIPGDVRDAIAGRWMPGPGEALFTQRNNNWDTCRWSPKIWE